MHGIEDLPFTIAELRRAYCAGLHPVDVVREVFRRLREAQDPGIFIAESGERVLLDEAETLGSYDGTKPLWGIPVAVKDNTDVRGMPTTAACPDFAYDATTDAEAVARLRRAGALIVGKTNLDQFATGLVGTRTPYPVPRNAIDPKLVPGGSSSGSAVAVARGIVPVALGTDTAGSGRVPAALNNIVGLKPTVGSVSTRGVVPACRSLDCVSVFGLTVEDCWIAYKAIAGYDAADPFSAATAARPVAPVGALRIGVPRHDDRIFTDPLHEAAYEAALYAAEENGGQLVAVDFTDLFDVAALLYHGPWLAERSAAIRQLLTEAPEKLLPVTRAIITRGTEFSAEDAFAGHYRLRELARRIERIWDEVDFLCVPSIPGPVTLDAIADDPVGPNTTLGTYTNFVNLLGLAALAVPAGERRDDLPAGVTLIGPAGSDAGLAAFGHRLHGATSTRLGATDWRLPIRRWHPEAAPPRDVPVVVFGAHLSGLPLNAQLTELGAVFAKAVRTAPDYRLFALEGTVPRPGLVRCAAGEGATIEGEIWTIPTENVGVFLGRVAAPLAIGSVRLDDGTVALGFIAESEGVRGRPEISRFGGWRAYLAAATAPSAVAR